MRQISRLRVAAETRNTPARNRGLTCNTFIKVENMETPVNRDVTVPGISPPASHSKGRYHGIGDV